LLVSPVDLEMIPVTSEANERTAWIDEPTTL
jgi:hypothetical protein